MGLPAGPGDMCDTSSGGAGNGGPQTVRPRPLLALGYFLVIGGLQFLTTGVLAELLIRIYYDRGEAAPYHRRDTAQPAPAEAWHQP